MVAEHSKSAPHPPQNSVSPVNAADGCSGAAATTGTRMRVVFQSFSKRRMQGSGVLVTVPREKIS